MGAKKHATAKKAKPKRGDKATPAEDGDAGPTERRQHKGGKQRSRAGHEHHWGGDDLERELAAVGLRIKLMEADGNCFYRSVLDQLQGEGGDHLGLRSRVVDFLEAREEEYRFFIEDDEPWAKYVKRMRKDGAWAGQLELQAASLLLEHNISVYQAGQPVWHIKNFGADAPVLHLSYHDGMHYNSVRNADDHGSGPPAPLRLGSGAAAAADPAAAAAFGGREVERVVEGTGCADRERVAAALGRCGGDVDHAIEMLIEQLGQEVAEEPQNADADAHADAEQRQQQQQGLQAQVSQQAAALQQEHRQQPGSSPAATQAEQQSDRGAEGGAEGAGQPPHPRQQQQGPCMRLELRPTAADPSHVHLLLHIPPDSQQRQQQKEQQQHAEQQGQEQEAAVGGGEAAGAPRPSGKRSSGKRGVKVRDGKPTPAGRNRRCPCGSTKKFKNCCGAARGERGGGLAAGATAAGEAAGEAAKQLQVLYI